MLEEAVIESQNKKNILKTEKWQKVLYRDSMLRT